MHDNTKPSSQFASIESDLLVDVQGGCGGRRRCCGCGNKQVNITNNYAGAPAAPAPAPSSGASVDVSVGYQQ